MQANSNFLFRGILKTKPIETDPKADTVLYSALNKPNCRAYILAAKSFLRFYPKISVVVQDDGTLDQKCKDELRTHIPQITIHSKESMRKLINEQMSSKVKQLVPDFENNYNFTNIKILYLKFFNVIYRFNNKKVIFLDSDMIVLRQPDDIIKWVEGPYMRDLYSGGGSLLAEAFHEIGFSFKHVDIANFNSGLIGIGTNVSEDLIYDIFNKIRKYDSSILKQWEIEQSVWSVVLGERENVFNIDDLAEIYIGSGWRKFRELKNKAIVAHFVGAIRFKNLRYLRLAWMVYKELRKE